MAHGSVEGKIYIPTERISLEGHSIWVQINHQWIQVNGLASDSNGIYVQTNAVLGFWTCSRCGYVNPPWNVLACDRCGQSK
jgi:hypothetical protein